MNLNIQINSGENINEMNQTRHFNQNQNYKINICFTMLNGVKINMIFDCNETMEDVITKFLKRLDLNYLIGNLQNKLKFILLAERFNYGDKRKLKDVLGPGCKFSNVIVWNEGLY